MEGSMNMQTTYSALHAVGGSTKRLEKGTFLSARTFVQSQASCFEALAFPPQHLVLLLFQARRLHRVVLGVRVRGHTPQLYPHLLHHTELKEKHKDSNRICPLLKCGNLVERVELAKPVA